jgi:hypothetical protein
LGAQHAGSLSRCVCGPSNHCERLQYTLDRRIQPEDVPAEGEEAWLAYDLLIGLDATDNEAVPPISADPQRDAVWLGARKVARHLGVAAPERTPVRVQEFVTRHIKAYLELRALGRRN